MSILPTTSSLRRFADLLRGVWPHVSVWTIAQAGWVGGELLLTVGATLLGAFAFHVFSAWLTATLLVPQTSVVAMSLPFFTLLAAVVPAYPLWGFIGFLARHDLGPALMRRFGWDLPLLSWVARQQALPSGPLREWVRACADAPSPRVLRALPLDAWAVLMARRDVWHQPAEALVRLLSRLTPADPCLESEVPPIVPPLVRFALAHPEREVRSAALCWLGAAHSSSAGGAPSHSMRLSASHIRDDAGPSA